MPKLQISYGMIRHSGQYQTLYRDNLAILKPIPKTNMDRLTTQRHIVRQILTFGLLNFIMDTHMNVQLTTASYGEMTKKIIQKTVKILVCKGFSGILKKTEDASKISASNCTTVGMIPKAIRNGSIDINMQHAQSNSLDVSLPITKHA